MDRWIGWLSDTQTKSGEEKKIARWKEEKRSNEWERVMKRKKMRKRREENQPELKACPPIASCAITCPARNRFSPSSSCSLKHHHRIFILLSLRRALIRAINLGRHVPCHPPLSPLSSLPSSHSPTCLRALPSCPLTPLCPKLLEHVYRLTFPAAA